MIEGCAREVVDEPKLRAPVRLNRVGGGRIRGQATACLTRRIPRSMHTACGRRASQFSMGHRQVNIFSCDPGLDGAGAILDERRDFIACFDLPTIREGTQRRVDAANLADLIREHAPYAFAIVEQVGARPGQGVSFAIIHSLACITS
jgi:hypothetical protein